MLHFFFFFKNEILYFYLKITFIKTYRESYKSRNTQWDHQNLALATYSWSITPTTRLEYTSKVISSIITTSSLRLTPGLVSASISAFASLYSDHKGNACHVGLHIPHLLSEKRFACFIYMEKPLCICALETAIFYHLVLE